MPAQVRDDQFTAGWWRAEDEPPVDARAAASMKEQQGLTLPPPFEVHVDAIDGYGSIIGFHVSSTQVFLCFFAGLCASPAARRREGDASRPTPGSEVVGRLSRAPLRHHYTRRPARRLHVKVGPSANSRFDDPTRESAYAEYLASIEPYRQGEAYHVPGEFVVVAGRA